jgi:excisionase family DNA binding protein
MSKDNPAPPKEFSVAEAAKITGYTKARIYQLVAEKKIPARLVRAREDWRIPRATVEELRLARAARTGEKA